MRLSPYVCMSVSMLVGIGLGAAASWKMASMRAKNDVAFFMEQTADNDTVMQEAKAIRAYLKGTPEQAYPELKSLLETYDRYVSWPEKIPGERAERDGFAAAVAHGRLAAICTKLGMDDEARVHLDQAIQHPGIGSEEKLATTLALLDKAEGKQWNLLP